MNNQTLCRYAYVNDFHGTPLCGCKLNEDKHGQQLIADEPCTEQDWLKCPLNEGQIKDLRRYPWQK